MFRLESDFRGHHGAWGAKQVHSVFKSHEACTSTAPGVGMDEAIMCGFGLCY